MRITLDYKNDRVKNKHSLILIVEKDAGYLHLMLSYDGRDFYRLTNQSENFKMTQRLYNHILSYRDIVNLKQNFRDFYYKFEEMILLD